MAPKFRHVGGEMRLLFDKNFPTLKDNPPVTVDGIYMTECYKKFADEIENFEVCDEDVWVCSFPKTGTTWTQEMVWNIAHGVELEKAKVSLEERFPFLELSAMMPPLTHFAQKLRDQDIHDLPPLSPILLNSVEFTKNHPSPRFIKTHLPFNLLPRQIRTGEKKPKIVYVARNAKDTCVSYYYHCKLLLGYKGTFEEFCALFLSDTLQWAPFWTHVLGFWERRDDDNILFLKFEAMKSDLSSVIKKTAEFLENDLSDEQITLLAEHLHFSNMKVNKAVNYEAIVQMSNKVFGMKNNGAFMRSGKTEQWRFKMTPDAIKQFDDWIDANLKGTGLTF